MEQIRHIGSYERLNYYCGFAIIFIECNLFEEERNDFFVCPAWEPRDEYQRTEDAMLEGFSVGTAAECCDTCGLSMPDGVAAVTCLDKGERRSKRSVCLDWKPKENEDV